MEITRSALLVMHEDTLGGGTMYCMGCTVGSCIPMQGVIHLAYASGFRGMAEFAASPDPMVPDMHFQKRAMIPVTDCRLHHTFSHAC